MSVRVRKYTTAVGLQTIRVHAHVRTYISACLVGAEEKQHQRRKTAGCLCLFLFFFLFSFFRGRETNPRRRLFALGVDVQVRP